MEGAKYPMSITDPDPDHVALFNRLKAYPNKYEGICGTKGYLAPEILVMAIDAHSTGICRNYNLYSHRYMASRNNFTFSTYQACANNDYLEKAIYLLFVFKTIAIWSNYFTQYIWY